MKLYLLEQHENNDYDTYDSCVVCAENENDAKNITPDSREFKDSTCNGSWVGSKESIKCTELGEANSNQKRGVIISSFNAG